MSGRHVKLFFFLLFSFITAEGQHYNNWFFGQNAGLTFNTPGFPIPRAVTGSAMTANEGCASISDANGQLLFYTNGFHIFNRDHEVMQNGDAIGGNESSFQSAVIVPMPNHDSLYYVFTCDAFENGFANGYRYSIVSILRDGGKGGVILKGQLLHGPSSERLTAARHANGVDIWIITNEHRTNVFRTWLLTCNGLQPTPVVSTSGEVLNQTDRVSIGSLKVSPDGKQMCQTHFGLDDDVVGTNNFFQVFDFNNATGAISNAKKVILPAMYVYSCEYSPNSQLLYLTHAGADVVSQVEAKLGTGAAIAASAVKLPASFSIYGIQLGPDRKIYLSRASPALAVIEKPDVKGLGCTLQVNKIPLGPPSRLCLPFVLNELTPDPNDFTFQLADSCSGTVRFFGNTTLPSPQWQWDFGDGTTSTLKDPVHVFTPAGAIYQVRLTLRSPAICGVIRKSAFVTPQGVLAKADFDFIGKCDSGYVRFVNRSQFLDSAAFLWSFGDGNFSADTSPIHSYANSGTFQVKLKVFTSVACAQDSITKTINLEQLNVQASPDQTITEGQTIQLNVAGNGTSFRWTPPTGLSNTQIRNPRATPDQTTTYIVTAVNDAGCVDVDSVHITVNPITEIYVPSAFTPNGDGRNDIFKPVAGINFRLQDFSVYNRWGQLVFSTRQKGAGWDGLINGKPQPSDIYVWRVKALNRQNGVIEKSGTVLLIR